MIRESSPLYLRKTLPNQESDYSCGQVILTDGVV